VERCQVAGNISYPQASLEYEEYIIQQAADVASRGKPHWLGLPAMATSGDSEGFSDAERDFVIGLLAGVPEPERRAVSTLMDGINTMYALLPATVRISFCIFDSHAIEAPLLFEGKTRFVV
jgi:hypothetical protein